MWQISIIFFLFYFQSPNDRNSSHPFSCKIIFAWMKFNFTANCDFLFHLFYFYIILQLLILFFYFLSFSLTAANGKFDWLHSPKEYTWLRAFARCQRIEELFVSCAHIHSHIGLSRLLSRTNPWEKFEFVWGNVNDFSRFSRRKKRLKILPHFSIK